MDSMLQFFSLKSYEMIVFHKNKKTFSRVLTLFFLHTFFNDVINPRVSIFCENNVQKFFMICHIVCDFVDNFVQSTCGSADNDIFSYVSSFDYFKRCTSRHFECLFNDDFYDQTFKFITHLDNTFKKYIEVKNIESLMCKKRVASTIHMTEIYLNYDKLDFSFLTENICVETFDKYFSVRNSDDAIYSFFFDLFGKK